MRHMSMDDLLRQYSPLMRYIIAPILPDERDREECLSDAALRIFSQLDKYDPDRGSFTTWLTVIVRNTALNHARRKYPQTEELTDNLEAPHANPEEILMVQERQQALLRALHNLSIQDRALFYRKYYYRQSTAQIAAETGLTQRAVEGRLYRIKARLRQKLGGDFYD